MTITEAIEILQQAKSLHGDIEVTAQSNGCCYYAHEINEVEIEECNDRGTVVVFRVG